ncbi:MAG TPA: penicillin-binding protein 2, partial [Candidatus Berkiella sp.]|nr:penicillin-binding protein 2 [Candidatus Berkiella sp.]
AWQTAQLTGFTDIDDQGQAGLELTFEQALKPTIGKKRVLEDRTGRWVKDLDYFQSARSGDEIALSIDLRIQGFAYRELEQAIQKYQAKSATLVMIDIP